MGLGRTSRVRCAVVWAGVTIVAAALMAGLEPVLAEAASAVGRGGSAGTGGVGGLGFEELLVWCCAAAAAVTTGWLWLMTTLVTVDAARGLLTVRRGVPQGLRRALLALCGVAVAGGLASGLGGPASAAGGTGSSGPEVPPQQLAGLRLPERTAIVPTPRGRGGERPSPRASTSAASPPAAVPAVPDAAVVVAAGDTLWGIAAEQLGPSASVAETAAAWPVLYALNRDLIGPDPGLIEPGQRLHLPPAEADGVAR